MSFYDIVKSWSRLGRKERRNPDEPMSTPNLVGQRATHYPVLMYCMLVLVFLGVGWGLVTNFLTGRESIIAERLALAVQTSKFVSQWVETTITNTDYVLRDLTTKATAADIEMAHLDTKTQLRLSDLARKKLSTLPEVYGLAFVDTRRIFIAAADERVIGYQSNSKLRAERTPVLENRAYIDYVPVTRSANKQPAILLSRPMLSPEGKFQGGALAAIMLSRAQAWMENFTLGNNATVTMVDDDGVLLAVNPRHPSGIGKIVQYPALKSDLSDQGGSTSFITVSPVDGRERIYGLSKIHGIPLNIIVGFDKAQTLQEWNGRLWQFLTGFIILFCLSLLMLRKHLSALAQRDELAQAMSEIRTLSGLLPICAWCKCIRDDTGYWRQIESYLSQHSDARFTHGICPQCAEKLREKKAEI